MWHVVGLCKTKYGLEKMFDFILGCRISHFFFFAERMGEKDLIVLKIRCFEVVFGC